MKNNEHLHQEHDLTKLPVQELQKDDEATKQFKNKLIKMISKDADRLDDVDATAE